RQGRAGEGEREAHRLVRRPGHEGVRRQGEPAGRQRTAQAQARSLTIARARCASATGSDEDFRSRYRSRVRAFEFCRRATPLCVRFSIATELRANHFVRDLLDLGRNGSCKTLSREVIPKKIFDGESLRSACWRFLRNDAPAAVCFDRCVEYDRSKVLI